MEVLELNQLDNGKKEMEKIKICFRCKKEINDKEHYFSFNEFLNKIIIQIDYCHNTCWNDFKKGIGNVDEAMNMLRGLKNSLTKQGLLPEEIIEIK